VRKVIIIIVIMLLMVTIGFYIIRSTIYYSIFQIYSSIKNHDIATFEAYVDIDSVLNNLGDDLQKITMESMSKEMESTKDQGEWAALGATIGASMVSMAMPGLIENGKKFLRQEIIRQIEDIQVVEKNKDNAEDSSLNGMINQDKFNLKEIFSRKKILIDKRGKVAKLTLLEQEEDKILITMRKMSNNSWRVVRLEIPFLFEVYRKTFEGKEEENVIYDARKNAIYISYYQEIRQKISDCAEKVYLKSKTTEEGEVSVNFIVASNGELLSMNIIEEKSSQSVFLRSLALETIRTSNPFLPFPEGMNQAQSNFNVILSFGLE